MMLVLGLASACPGDDASSGEVAGVDSSTTAGTTQSSDATADETSNGTSGTDTGTGTNTATSTSSEDSSSDTGPLLCESDPAEALDAILEVTIELVNDTADPVYLIGSADNCRPFGIAQDGRELPLAIGHLCGCECPAPPTPTVEVIALDPGQTHELSWDGRTLALYEERYLCETECWTSTNGVPQPQPAGSLTLTIPVYDSLDAPRQDQLGGLENRCASPLSFDVAFDLGNDDLALSVMLSTVTIR